MSALPTNYPYAPLPNTPHANPPRMPAIRNVDTPIIAPSTRRNMMNPGQQAQRQEAYNNTLGAHSYFQRQNASQSYPTALPMTPYAENNIAGRAADNAAQSAANQYRANAFASAQDSVLSGGPSTAGDGSFKNTNQDTLNPSAPGVYKLPSMPQQKGPEFDDYTLRAWHDYNQRFPDERRSLRDFATTFKPAQDKLDQQANAAYASNPQPSLPQATANARRDSAANIANLNKAMSSPDWGKQWRQDRTATIASQTPGALPAGPPAPPTATATPQNGSQPPTQLPQGSPAPTPPATTYSNNGLQGQGSGHLPGSDRVQGAALDALGAKYGIERGRVVINGQDFGPRKDDDYAGLIRAHVGQQANASLPNDPAYQAAQQKQANVQQARQQGVGVSTINQEKATAAMSPSDRLESQWQGVIQQLPPGQQAAALDAYNSHKAAIAQADQRIADAKDAETKKLEMRDKELAVQRAKIDLQRQQGEAKLKADADNGDKNRALKEKELGAKADAKPKGEGKPIVGENTFDAGFYKDNPDDKGFKPPFKFPGTHRWVQSPSGKFARNFFDDARHFKDYEFDETSNQWLNRKTKATFDQDQDNFKASNPDAPPAAPSLAQPSPQATPATPAAQTAKQTPAPANQSFHPDEWKQNPDGTFSHPDAPEVKYRNDPDGYHKVS